MKMGEKYLERYHRHFENPDIRRHNMQHEELLICFPEQWAEEVLRSIIRMEVGGIIENNLYIKSLQTHLTSSL